MVGLRQHHGHRHRSIAQSLESEEQADFFRKWGLSVVVQDNFGHGVVVSSVMAGEAILSLRRCGDRIVSLPGRSRIDTVFRTPGGTPLPQRGLVRLN